MPQNKLSQYQSNMALWSSWFHISNSHAMYPHEIGTSFNLPQTDISHHKHSKLLNCQRWGFITNGIQSLLVFCFQFESNQNLCCNSWQSDLIVDAKNHAGNSLKFSKLFKISQFVPCDNYFWSFASESIVLIPETDQHFTSAPKLAVCMCLYVSSSRLAYS